MKGLLSSEPFNYDPESESLPATLLEDALDKKRDKLAKTRLNLRLGEDAET